MRADRVRAREDHEDVDVVNGSHVLSHPFGRGARSRPSAHELDTIPNGARYPCAIVEAVTEEFRSASTQRVADHRKACALGWASVTCGEKPCRIHRHERQRESENPQYADDGASSVNSHQTIVPKDATRCSTSSYDLRVSSTASAAPAPSRRRLAVFPVYRDNPYLNLMLLAPRAAGWEVLESARLEAFEQDVRSLSEGDALHVHWTAPIVQRANTPEEGRGRLQSFQVAVDDAQRRGATVIWTIHNALPHDVQHRTLELELSRFLAATADVIHVMNSSTAQVVEDDYSLPRAKLVHIPHPSYRGVYETGLSREEARASFGLAEDDFAVLFFGQVRPYKGVDLLIDAFRRTKSTDRFVFMLAGRTSPEDRAVIDAMLPEGLRCVRHHDFLDDGEVERWFAAADLAVLPYRRILNSGTLHLAATYGAPVALPDEAHLRKEFGSEQWVSWFRPGDADDLAAVLERRPSSANGAAAFSDRLSPFSVSRRYATMLARATRSRDLGPSA